MAKACAVAMPCSNPSRFRCCCSEMEADLLESSVSAWSIWLSIVDSSQSSVVSGGACIRHLASRCNDANRKTKSIPRHQRNNKFLRSVVDRTSTSNSDSSARRSSIGGWFSIDGDNELDGVNLRD